MMAPACRPAASLIHFLIGWGLCCLFFLVLSLLSHRNPKIEPQYLLHVQITLNEAQVTVHEGKMAVAKLMQSAPTLFFCLNSILPGTVLDLMLP